MKGGGASGTVQGYRDDAPEPMVNAMWHAGSDDDWPFNGVITFYVGDPAAGVTLPLPDHPIDWLVRLVSAASAAVAADQARIETVPLADELMDARFDSVVGALTLAPHGIDLDVLPASVSVRPCPVGYPDGAVLVADLQQVTTDPAALVDDLLVLDDALRR
jgi:hypothetical protein